MIRVAETAAETAAEQLTQYCTAHAITWRAKLTAGQVGSVQEGLFNMCVTVGNWEFHSSSWTPNDSPATTEAKNKLLCFANKYIRHALHSKALPRDLTVWNVYDSSLARPQTMLTNWEVVVRNNFESIPLGTSIPSEDLRRLSCVSLLKDKFDGRFYQAFVDQVLIAPIHAPDKIIVLDCAFERSSECYIDCRIPMLVLRNNKSDSLINFLRSKYPTSHSISEVAPDHVMAIFPYANSLGIKVTFSDLNESDGILDDIYKKQQLRRKQCRDAFSKNEMLRPLSRLLKLVFCNARIPTEAEQRRMFLLCDIIAIRVEFERSGLELGATSDTPMELNMAFLFGLKMICGYKTYRSRMSDGRDISNNTYEIMKAVAVHALAIALAPPTYYGFSLGKSLNFFHNIRAAQKKITGTFRPELPNSLDVDLPIIMRFSPLIYLQICTILVKKFQNHSEVVSEDLISNAALHLGQHLCKRQNRDEIQLKYSLVLLPLQSSLFVKFRHAF
ncbi:hypothetical protein BCR33DRAFT_766921 [Rhizoclosmatium globosum]|uniref:Uncharacterized protein n=1 Tax=Rhizoclosmatium globosum TaxID=329046 RepID=A0A1Y2C7M2_9FUNG|nr:hypothetical protein BCR33DRAFT_766921 [Rhizoclosmatium globosum]|eukprot:ORY42894.1 hypothetical protein BCR33DRAFT_766921 [Rhizoclosmatium globosum]